MTAVLRLVRHYLLRKPHVARHARPEPLALFPMAADDLIPFAPSTSRYTRPYDSPKDAA